MGVRGSGGGGGDGCIKRCVVVWAAWMPVIVTAHGIVTPCVAQFQAIAGCVCEQLCMSVGEWLCRHTCILPLVDVQQGVYFLHWDQCSGSLVCM